MTQAMAPSKVDVSVIVVNYNTAHLLKGMRDALTASSEGLSIELIIVDNASRDDSADVLRRDFDDATVILNDKNVGFGRANNQGLVHAHGRHVLLLNTDAFVAPDTLMKTVQYMDAHPDCGILGVRLVGRDGVLQPCCRYFPTPWNLFLNRTGLHSLFPGIRLVDDMHWDHASVRECDWVVGCYFFIRREVVDQVGLFDPRYFLYSEEVDLCRAAKSVGWKVVFFPKTTVVHIGGESAKSDSHLTPGRQISALQIESELLYFRKNHGFGGLLAALALSTLGDIMDVVKGIVKRRGVIASAARKHLALYWSSAVQTRLGLRSTR
jgi:N-acetylglucosaminyl-diphospho-decaprenol L-rhamnosyltransferase